MEIAIVGSGYVGLVTGACFASVGNIVHCIDVNADTIAMLREGRVHIYEPQLEELVQSNIKEERLFFSTQLQDILHQVDCVFICVGTPTREDGSCNVDYVYAVAEEIAESVENDIIVIVKSTVPVGTTSQVDSIIRKGIKKRAVSCSVQCVSNPEFLKEGSAIEDFKRPDRIIVGTDSNDTREFFEELYAPFSRSKNKLLFMSVKSAEMSKYAANSMLATKISFINEMAMLCEKNGADISEVRVGIGSDSRIGYHFIYPGLGYGGSCFPKDVKALISQGNTYNLEMNMLCATEAINAKQKQFLFHAICEYFGSENLKNKVIALWGIAFKPNTDDIREAPAIYTIERCLEFGAKIRAYDPIAMQNAQKYFSKEESIYFSSDMYDALDGADILCIATEWNLFHQPDFTKIKDLLRIPYIIDGRNIYTHDMLRKKGIEYKCVGITIVSDTQSNE